MYFQRNMENYLSEIPKIDTGKKNSLGAIFPFMINNNTRWHYFTPHRLSESHERTRKSMEERRMKQYLLICYFNLMLTS